MDERLLDVNEHGVLRVPGLMWAALLLLARHWFWVLFIVLSAGSGGGSMVLLKDGMPWWPLAAQLPVILLLIAVGRRAPSGGRLVRRVWLQGRVLVSATMALNLCWTIWNLLHSQDWQPRPEMVLVCFSLLDMVVAWGMWTSPHWRQVFSEFPPAAVGTD